MLDGSGRALIERNDRFSLDFRFLGIAISSRTYLDMTIRLFTAVEALSSNAASGLRV
jgi:hypothetical protein